MRHFRGHCANRIAVVALSVVGEHSSAVVPIAMQYLKFASAGHDPLCNPNSVSKKSESAVDCVFSICVSSMDVCDAA